MGKASVGSAVGEPRALRDTAEGANGRAVARVLLDSSLPQLDHLFDYAIPDEFAELIRVGHRVRVPFRSQNRRSHGFVVSFTAASDFGGELQPISEIVGEIPVLTPQVWQLARAVADRAGGSAGDILRLAIPQRMVRAEKQFLADQAAQNLESQPMPADASPSSEISTEHEPSGNEHSGNEHSGNEHDKIAQLLVNGSRLAVTASHGPARLETGEWVGSWAVMLAKRVLAVYETGHSVIAVLPDYRDLDQLVETLEALGHTHTLRVDARQSGSARYASFLRALEVRPRIIVGNRSAVYAPAHRLGAIVLWDDGDPLLAEPLSPYVHARDAALVRAEQSGAGLLFCAHSRSTEVQRLVDIGYVSAEKYPPRRTRVMHADSAIAPEAVPGRVPEFAAQTIRRALTEGPVLVQVASPGYAPVAVCDGCNELARCRHCAGPIKFQSAHTPACRWCGIQERAWKCQQCGSRTYSHRGMGSQRTTEQFEQQFSGARVILSDGDHPHERVDSRSALVVATRGAEPIAAGGYRAVILLDVERMLSYESLRAAEDCMRWWQNAAALAAEDGVCVFASGAGPTVQAMVTGRIEEWLRAELRDRYELRYPPTVRVASVSGGAAEVERALATLTTDDTLPGVDILGPTSITNRDSEASLVRAIVRFEYAQGQEVAKRLRGALVADAAGSSSRAAGRRPGRARDEALRLRFDDRGVFDE